MQVYNISRNNSLKYYLQKNNIDYDNFYKQPEYDILDYNKKNNNGKIVINNVKNNFFVKYSPLVDPIKYITNSYIEQKVENNENIRVEKYLNNEDYYMDLHNDNSYEDNMKKLKNKINYPMNCAFIDSFFTHLSSLLISETNFYHGLNIFTSFTCIKEDYKTQYGSTTVVEKKEEPKQTTGQKIRLSIDNDYIRKSSDNLGEINSPRKPEV